MSKSKKIDFDTNNHIKFKWHIHLEKAEVVRLDNKSKT